MNIGYIALGKVGLPMALVAESKGHKIFGCDSSKEVTDSIRAKKVRYKEIGMQRLLDKTKIDLGNIEHVISNCKLVFCVVQTPHDPKYEGVTRMPKTRADFDYTHLKNAVKEIADTCSHLRKKITLVVMCTVLPGTLDREIKPLLNEYVTLLYNPILVAMGQVIPDYLNPEFVLIGCDKNKSPEILRKFYETIHDVECFVTDIRTAELIKVCYNTFITTKICYINTMMEMCHKIGANVDDVSNALALATHRIISPRYLQGGGPDSGGCHPRDNIAMSWLADKIGLSYNTFDAIMTAREKQTEWLVDLLCEHPLPKVILGKTFKPETNITVGSGAILMANMLEERGEEFTMYDPYVDDCQPEFQKSVFLVATKHKKFAEMKFPVGSVVIDPHRYIKKQDGVTVIGVGKNEDTF